MVIILRPHGHARHTWAGHPHPEMELEAWAGEEIRMFLPGLPHLPRARRALPAMRLQGIIGLRARRPSQLPSFNPRPPNSMSTHVVGRKGQVECAWVDETRAPKVSPSKTSSNAELCRSGWWKRGV